MALLENWQPLNLPRGSVRTIVTFILLVALWTRMLHGSEISFLFAALVLVVLGSYLGGGASGAGGEKPPIYLPRGLIHSLILAGFAAVAWVLWSDGRLHPTLADRNAVILALTGALFLGRIVRRAANAVARAESSPPRRWFENAKAIAVLLAALLLVAASFTDLGEGRAESLQLVLVAVVAFYFGSR